MTIRRKETKSKSRQLCPGVWTGATEECSDFELLSGSDEEENTALDALTFSYVRGGGRGHAVVWDGRIEDDSSSDDDLPWGRTLIVKVQNLKTYYWKGFWLF